MTGKPPPSLLPAVLVLVHDQAARTLVCGVVAPMARLLVVDTLPEAEDVLRRETVGVLIIEDELPGETGIMFLGRINQRYPWLRRLLVCRAPDSELLLHLFHEANVFRCVPKPIAPIPFQRMVAAAIDDHLRAYALAVSAEENARILAALERPGVRARRFAAALTAWVASLPRIFGLALLAAVWVFLLGVVVLLALYSLKSFLGIDLIERMHLVDLLR